VNPTTGAIDQTAHNRFMQNYGRTLDAYAQNGVDVKGQLQSLGKEVADVTRSGQRVEGVARSLKFDTSGDLVDAAIGSQKVMGNTLMRLPPDVRPTFTRMVLDKAMSGGTADSLTRFLDENQKTLSMIPGAKDHINNLRTVAKAWQIAERAPLRGNVQSGGPDILKNETGVSTATVYAQFRAVTGNRQAPVTMAFNLAAPALTKLGQTKFSNIMEQALHSDETARDLARLLRANTAPQAESLASKILSGLKEGGQIMWSAKGPVLKHVIGVQHYPSNFGRAAIPIADQAQQGGNQ